MSFADDLRKYAIKTERNLGQVARATKIKLFQGVIMSTRVDTGRLRGNWQTSTGAPKFTSVDRADDLLIDEPGGSAYDEVIGNVTAFGVDYLTNNLPYAKVWEERDGMIAKNATRIERNLREAVQDVKD